MEQAEEEWKKSGWEESCSLCRKREVPRSHKQQQGEWGLIIQSHSKALWSEASGGLKRSRFFLKWAVALGNFLPKMWIQGVFMGSRQTGREIVWDYLLSRKAAPGQHLL